MKKVWRKCAEEVQDEITSHWSTSLHFIQITSFYYYLLLQTMKVHFNSPLKESSIKKMHLKLKKTSPKCAKS